MRERRGGYRGLMGKSERRKPLGRPRCGCEDNIKKDFEKWDWKQGLDSSGSG
jgi:hypothetical protein